MPFTRHKCTICWQSELQPSPNAGVAQIFPALPNLSLSSLRSIRSRKLLKKAAAKAHTKIIIPSSDWKSTILWQQQTDTDTDRHTDTDTLLIRMAGPQNRLPPKFSTRRLVKQEYDFWLTAAGGRRFSQGEALNLLRNPKLHNRRGEARFPQQNITSFLFFRGGLPPPWWHPR